MAYGIQVYSETGVPLLSDFSTGMRIVRKIECPIYTGNAQSNFTIPEFDDTLGMFTWNNKPVVATTGNNFSYPFLPFSEMHFNNTTKILRVTHSSGITSDPGLSFEIVFFHYR